MRIKNTFIIFILALAFNGCGFTPMYAAKDSDVDLLAAFEKIRVSPIPERVGQMLWNNLIDRLNPRGEPSIADYELRISLEEKALGFGFRSDAAVTRESYTLEANIKLFSNANNAVVYENKQQSVISYDIVQSDFANYNTRLDAKSRAAEELAKLIAIRLAFYFNLNSADKLR